MHREAYQFIEAMAGKLPNPEKVVEFGSRYINGSVRNLFKDSETYIGVDIAPGSHVNVVMPAQDYKPSFQADMVICCEVLEHVDAEEGYAIIKNGVDILKPGGSMLCTAAYIARTPHSAVDGGAVREGEYYGNLTEERLKYWANSLKAEYDFPISFEAYIRPDQQDVYFVITTDVEPVLDEMDETDED